jgi:Protein of unknown function (DUF1629)
MMIQKSINWAEADFTPESALRFYAINSDPEAPGYGLKFNWMNKREVSPPYAEQRGRHPLGVAGRMGVGLIPLYNVPRYQLAPRVRTEIDFYFNVPNWIVSDRARRMFKELDGAAFEFEEAHVTHGKDSVMALGPYWRMDIYRVLDCIDDAASIVEGGPSGLDPSIFQYIRLIDIRMKPEVLGNAHAFRVRQGYGPIFDSVIVDEIRSRKYRGMAFTPLQMPTFAETKSANLGDNSWHWREKSPIKGYWDARQAEFARRYQEELAAAGGS